MYFLRFNSQTLWHPCMVLVLEDSRHSHNAFFEIWSMHGGPVLAPHHVIRIYDLIFGVTSKAKVVLLAPEAV